MIGGFYSVDMDLLQKEPQVNEFELRCDVNHCYNRKVYTNNGRTATVYTLQNGLKLTADDVILVPDYQCVSVLNALEMVPAQRRYYRIRRDLTVDLEDLRSKIDASVKVIYLIHYFGMPQPLEVAEAVQQLSKEHGLTIIEDLTQTLYTRMPGRIGYGDYLVASTRKWMPVTDGGIMAARDGVHLDQVPLKDAYDKAAYTQLTLTLYRQYYDAHPDAPIDGYLKMEKAANAARYLDFSPREMTDLTRTILMNMDHQNLISRRRKNYDYLYQNLKNIDGLTILSKPLDDEGGMVPFGFTVLVEERQKFYQYLADHRIIGEIQWILPTEYYTPGEDAQYLSAHNLMLQCDQRYEEADMELVVNRIKQYFGGC